MPRNCNECEYRETCQSYFGGLGCKHKDEIAQQTNDENK